MSLEFCLEAAAGLAGFLQWRVGERASIRGVQRERPSPFSAGPGLVDLGGSDGGAVRGSMSTEGVSK